MPNNKQFKINNDINECTSRGVCSLSPTVAAMQELLILFLEQSAFYIIKLEKLGGNNKNILLKIIDDIASLNIANSVNERQLYDILIHNYQVLKDVEKTYINYSEKYNIPYELLSLPVDFSENLSYSKVISLGEKLFLINYKRFSTVQKHFTDIMFVIIKSVCENLSGLKDYDIFYKEGYQAVLESLNLLNKLKCSETQIRSKIKALALIDNKINKLLAQNLFEKFGQINKVNVSHSTRPGKAILVSGSNYFDLYNILEETKDKDIDVYTHSNLLIAHSLKNFLKYKNLIGHYGNNTESCIVDYGTFPGAILLTRGERNSNEYFYRGRIFSNDYFTNSGIIKVENNDYKPLLEAAKSSKGFSKGKIKNTISVGFDMEKTESKFQIINNNLKNGTIKHLYVIGLNSYSESQKEYFKEFFESLKDDEFALSFFYESGRDNVLTINIGNYAPLGALLLSKLFSEKEIGKNVTFIYTRCDAMTISGIVTLKNRGAENIYMAECSPTIINPSVFKSFLENYGVIITDNARQDILKMRS